MPRLQGDWHSSADRRAASLAGRCCCHWSWLTYAVSVSVNGTYWLDHMITSPAASMEWYTSSYLWTGNFSSRVFPLSHCQAICWIRQPSHIHKITEELSQKIHKVISPIYTSILLFQGFFAAWWNTLILHSHKLELSSPIDKSTRSTVLKSCKSETAT